MHPNDGRVVSNFIVQAISGAPITIYGDGSQTRSFCFVSDMIKGFLKMAAQPPDFFGPVNLGNPQEISILELAEQVIAMTGSKSEIIREPLPENDPRKRKPCIDLARDKLGWTPEIDLETGLQSTIDYFEKELKKG